LQQNQFTWSDPDSTRVADFAKALLQRSKADQLDAEVMLEFVRRMPFVACGTLRAANDWTCAP